MKLVFVVLLPFLIYAKPVFVIGWPKVHIKETKSGNDIPDIHITFPDGFQDHLVLERYYMTDFEPFLRDIQGTQKNKASGFITQHFSMYHATFLRAGALSER